MKKALAAALLAFFLVALFSGCAVVHRPVLCGIDNVYILTNAEKYGKFEEIEPTPETKIVAALAQNEGEGMQFVYRPDEAQENVRVTVSDLVLDGGTEKIEDVTVYYQYYHYIDDDYGTGRLAGWYPDLLIPINGDCADLNSLDVEEEQNQGYWITVYSDKNQTAGLYKGEITLETDGGEIRNIPVEVTVWDFAVPEEHSFDAPYGYKGYAPVASYEAGYDFLLRYRLNGNRVPTVLAKNLTSEDAAKVTAEYLETHPGVSHFQASMYTKEYFDELERYGILDKCHTYVFDEPDNSDETNKKLSEEYARLHAMNPNIKNMVTTASRDTITDVDIWCGIWAGSDCDELTVRDRTVEGYEMWWYGCLAPKMNYPTYHIQDDLISARLVHWMQKDWGFQGNLYWRVDSEKLYDVYTKKTKDTLRNIYTETAIFYNSSTGDDYASPAGDGYLIAYAREGDGVVNRNMILPTLRLEAIRDGSEDFEYLTALEKKITALFEKWGVTEVTVDSCLDTYFDALYTSMADFDRDPQYMTAMRRRIAHDILHAESVVDVEAAPTFENPNGRVVTVYAENGSGVVIDGQTVQGESRGKYSVYTRYFDMNGIADRTEITVSVNGEEYTRVLKSVEDMELMEESRAAVQSDAEELGLSVPSKTVRKAFEENTFMPYTAPFGGAPDPAPHRCISENREYAAAVRKCLAKDINNTIPLAVMNEHGNLVKAPNAEYLTLYVPNGATVRVEGKAATLVKQTEQCSVYTAMLDTAGDVRYFYDVEVTLNGVTENWKKVVFNRSAETAPLINMSAEDLAEKLAAEPKNAGTEFEVVEYEGAPAVRVAIDAEHSLTVPKSLIPSLNLKQYKNVVFDIVCLAGDCDGFAVSVGTSFGSTVAEAEIPQNGIDGCLFAPLSVSRTGRVTSVTVLTSTKYPNGGTFIIRGLYAMKDIDDIANK